MIIINNPTVNERSIYILYAFIYLTLTLVCEYISMSANILCFRNLL